jgi:hypothetical protein
MCHQARGSTHVTKTIDNLLNRNNSLTTRACTGDSSIETPTLKMLLSSSSTTTAPTYDPST